MFSSTVTFSVVRLLISLTVDPRFSVESYDLSGAFLGTKLRDRVVYIRIPMDAGVHTGKILLLKKSVYGLKTSGRDFITQLAEQMDQLICQPSGVTRTNTGIEGTTFYRAKLQVFPATHVTL
jgi:hypothetical protein